MGSRLLAFRPGSRAPAGYAEVRNDERAQGAGLIRQTLRELRPYLAGRSWRLLALCIFAITGGIAEAAALMLTVRVAISVGSGTDFGGLGLPDLSAGRALLIAAAAEGIAFAFHVLIARTAADLAATVLRETRKAALSRYIRAPWSIQSIQREGAIQELVTSLSFRISELTLWFAFGLGQAIILAMFVAAAMAVDWRFTLAILLAGTAAVVLLRPLARVTQRRARKFVDANSYYAEEISRLTSSTMELKSYGVGPTAEKQLQDLNDDVSQRQFETRFSALFTGSVFKDIAVCLLIGSVAGLYWLGTETLVNAGVVVTLIVRGLASAQQASSSYQFLSEAAPNLASFNRRLAEMHEEIRPAANVAIGEFEQINLVDVGYSYDGHTQAVHAVDLQISAGDFVGVVGRSGGGKSTLLQLILRLRRPTSGAIRVNGHDYTDVPTERWHELVSLVPQEPGLLEATIAENIAYYRRIPEPAILEAARAANIFDEIMTLPNGFETRLGPRGSGLSGGQKQRIAIARALAGNPSVLVMDEPTSALDGASEQAVLETIEGLRGSTTLILVAHRLSTVAHCDYLVEVADGRVTLR